MKAALIAATAVVGLTGAALAGGPQLMTDDQMDKVVAGDFHDFNWNCFQNCFTAGGAGAPGGGTGGLDPVSFGTLPDVAGGYGGRGGGDGCGPTGTNSC